MQSIARRSRGIITGHFKAFGVARTVKGDKTPFTEADEETSLMMLDCLQRFAPSIDVIGEEHSNRTASPWRYYKDPIDGTFPFTWGMPIVTNMQGLTYEGEPVCGVIYDPFGERMYSAEKGRGAWLEGRYPSSRQKLSVSQISDPAGKPVVGFVSWKDCGYNILKVCSYLEERGVQLVNFCSIGYMEAAVATGEFAGTIFPGTHCHDTMPGHIIVTEAGGTVTDLFGKPINYAKNAIQGHIMSNGRIHDLLVEAVQACN
jgi:myo-inositol-1(or 4)-monophosphatase